VSPSKVFCGTSVVDFTFWVQNFTMEATIAGVWDMIAPPDGATAAMTVALNGVAGNLDGQAIITALVEDYFTAIVPPNATYTLARNIMDKKLEDLEEFYEARVFRISDNHRELSPAEVNKKLDNCQKDWESKRFKIEQSEEKIYGELVAAVSAYDRVKNEHAQRKAKCMKLFQTMLGASPKAIIRSDLLAGRFRSAFSPCTCTTTVASAGSRTLLTCTVSSRTSSVSPRRWTSWSTSRRSTQ
jgi:hypothetical protein